MLRLRRRSICLLLLLLLLRILVVRWGHLVRVDGHSVLRLLGRSVWLLLLLWRVLCLRVVRGGEFLVGFFVFVGFVAFVGGVGEHDGARGWIGLVGGWVCEGKSEGMLRCGLKG